MGLRDRRRGGQPIRDAAGPGRHEVTPNSFRPIAGPFSSEALRARYIESSVKALQTGA